MWDIYRMQLLRLISEAGKKFEIPTTWENAHKSQRNGLFSESEYSNHSWFFIKDGKEAWYLEYNSSDGGCCNSKGPLVSGYKARYTTEIGKHIALMCDFKNQENSANSNYRRLKYKDK